MTPEEEIKKLSDEIDMHNYAYYVEDLPILPDADFDVMYRRLRDLEIEYPQFKTPCSPTQRVGSPVLNKFEKIEHVKPLLSLDNAFNSEELNKFLNDLEEELYCCEPKFDGLAVNLMFENGIFVKGGTRGNSTVGEDLTPNLKTLPSIPLRLKTDTPPKFIELRGEVVMPHDVFRRLNEEAIQKGEKPLANPRNSAAGALRRLDSSETAKRGLQFFLYDVGTIEGYDGKWPTSQLRQLELLATWGIKASYLTQRLNKSKVPEYIQMLHDQRDKLPFEIDGAVIKVDNLPSQDEIGFTSKVPNWAIAYKYPPQEVSTVLLSVVFQVGRTGTITPVAKLKPVKCGGVMVSSATLFNDGRLEALGLRPGDVVKVSRAGDVVPQVTGLVKTMSPDLEIIRMPKQCPCCLTPLRQDEGQAAHYCNNGFECSEQLLGYLTMFVSKSAMDMDGLGESLIVSLVNAQKVVSPLDLYKLTEQDIMELDGKGLKSAQNVIDSIHASRVIKLPNVIYSLGIQDIGVSTAKWLARRYGTLEAFLNASIAELLLIDGIGKTVGGYIEDWLSSESNQLFAKRLNGTLNIHEDAIVEQTLTGKSIVITGSFEQVNRNDAITYIEARGGKVSKSVSKNTDVLFAGANAGSKLGKAEQLGIPVRNESLLSRLLNDDFVPCVISKDEFLEKLKADNLYYTANRDRCGETEQKRIIKCMEWHQDATFTNTSFIDSIKEIGEWAATALKEKDAGVTEVVIEDVIARAKKTHSAIVSETKATEDENHDLLADIVLTELENGALTGKF